MIERRVVRYKASHSCTCSTIHPPLSITHHHNHHTNPANPFFLSLYLVSITVSCFLLDENTFQPSTKDESGDDEWTKKDALCDMDEQRAATYPHLRQAFTDSIDQFGPNDFFVLQKSLKEDCANPPLRSVIALLKLSDWDPDVFFKFRDVILNQAPSCGIKLRNDLIRGIPRVWTNYYMMDLEKDIAFEIGRFYYGIRDYHNALWYYMESTRTIGEHHVTFHNQGLCHYSNSSLPTALENFKKALALNKDYEKARSWVEKVEKEISDRAERDKEKEKVEVQ